MTDFSQRLRGHESVAEIIFDGGIQVCQVGGEETEDQGKMWKIRWEAGQYDHVHVDEYLRISTFAAN